jgi:flavin-dependent dehydrogenase
VPEAIAVDVVVVGAGPAGCAAAASAVGRGATVALLHHAPGGDARAAFTVGEGAAPGISQLIDEIFGREARAFSADAHLGCPSIISAWGSPEPAIVDHMLNPLGRAWSLDRNRFDSDLRAAAERLGVHVLRGAKANVAERDAGGWAIEFTDEARRARAMRGRVVIDASGRGARVARQQGARKHHLDRQVALWSVWMVDECDRSSSLYIEAVQGGWWYSALLPRQRRMVVYLSDADLLPADPPARLRLAESARGLDLVGSLLDVSDRPRLVSGPRLTSARTGWLEPFGGPAWVSAGDAACTFDPLSGRGMIAALLSGRTAGVAAASLLGDEDAGAEIERHEHDLAAMVQDALVQRADTYGAERRWPESEFWARRHRVEVATGAR